MTARRLLRRKRRGEGKPETFNFLGFTHICGTNHKTGKFTVQRKTIGKRMAAKRKDIRAKLRRRMHERIPGTAPWLGNRARMKAFRNDVQRLWLRTLRRRSQRSRLTWEKFRASLGSLLPPVQISQPYPDARFDANHPHIRGRNRVRWERQHGSVRGAAGNRCPYRDPYIAPLQPALRSRLPATPPERGNPPASPHVSTISHAEAPP